MATDIATPPPKATTRSPVRVLICDDHEIVREGLRTLLAGRPEMRVVAEAGTAAEAIETAVREAPDVVIMDVRLPDGSGVEACRSIREILPATRVIMLTSYPDDDALYASIIAGASGYLLKQTRAKALVEAIDAVSNGRALLDPDVTARVLARATATRSRHRTSATRSRCSPASATTRSSKRMPRAHGRSTATSSATPRRRPACSGW